MYDNLIGLRFRNLYAGAVFVPTKGDSALYSTMQTSPPASFAALSTWYFDHEDEKGALWVAVGGEHPEPIGGWLEYARQNLAHCEVRCVSVIAALLDNGGSIPDPSCACYFTIRRTALNAERVRTLADANLFTLFLPHKDEFLIIAKEGPNWRDLRMLEDPIAPMIGLNFVHRTDGTPRPPSNGNYDPIASQVNEVIGAVTVEARRAVVELIEEWKVAWPDRPVPDDMERRASDIDEEHRRMKDLVRSSDGQDGTHDDLLWQIDRYAHTLRDTRRAAVATRRKLREYLWTPGTYADYSRMAMPMMLRAIERYAVDIAERFGLTGYVFLPGFGDEFGMNARLFQSFQRPRRVPGSTTVLLELPGEVRLRLGALPMIAREIARKKESSLTQIAKCVAQLENRGNPDVQSMMPRNDDDPALALEVGEYLAADLLATAITGPQYVYAMARFAVGHLAETTVVGTPPENRPRFPVRLNACLALLRALGREGIQFESIYLPATSLHMPDEIVDIVRHDVNPTGYPNTETIDAIADGLRQGEVVDGRPSDILAALWRAVVARSGFLNEVSALVSVARWH